MCMQRVIKEGIDFFKIGGIGFGSLTVAEAIPYMVTTTTLIKDCLQIAVLLLSLITLLIKFCRMFKNKKQTENSNDESN